MPRITAARRRPPLVFFPCALLLPVLLAAVLLAPAGALAHRVNIFAWLEGGSIMVECGFNRSTPVRGGLVTVFDAADGRELLQGRTDATGLFHFPVPETVRQGHGLRIEVNAGEGHVNDWTMTAAEITEAQDLSHGFQEARPAPESAPPAPAVPPLVTPAAPQAPVAPPAATREVPPLPAQQPATAQEVRAIVGEALASGLAPLRRELAALSSPAPTLRDIIGGLGWIMGLIGIACYFLARRKQHKP